MLLISKIKCTKARAVVRVRSSEFTEEADSVKVYVNDGGDVLCIGYKDQMPSENRLLEFMTMMLLLVLM